jgi:N-6 DNA Methylase/TaqI-like C-terminal specificity domain
MTDSVKQFLKKMKVWRKKLAIAISSQKPNLSPPELTNLVQSTLLNSLFLKLCQDRNIDLQENLKFQVLDDFLLTIQSAIAQDLQQFDPLPIYRLGQIYEQFLGQEIGWSDRQTIIFKHKSNLKKSGGIFYTPIEIVDYIIEQTVGQALQQKTPDQIENFTILDPACGSGIFLIRAYEFLLNWYLQAYQTNLQQYSNKLTKDNEQNWQLTFAEKQRILTTHIYGVDIDQTAVEIVRRSLWLKTVESISQQELMNSQQISTQWMAFNQTIKCGNSLIDSDTFPNYFQWEKEFPQVFSTGGFDIVIGNPPYIDSEWMTKYQPQERQYYSDRYQSASGNWDLFCVFIERSLQLCKPQGLTSLVVPNKLLSAPYAVAIRSILTRKNSLFLIRDYSKVRTFSAAVYPIVFIARKGDQKSPPFIRYEQMESQADGTITLANTQTLKYPEKYPERCTDQNGKSKFWSIGIQCSNHFLERVQMDAVPLVAIATIQGSATVSESYLIQPLIKEQVPNLNPDFASEQGFSLVNSGTINRYQILWGYRKTRYLKKQYHYPMIPLDNISDLPKKRLEQTFSKKVIIAGMTRSLECVIDLKGLILAGKSTVIVTASDYLEAILAILNSRLMSVYYQSLFGGDALSGGYLRIGTRQVRSLPIPQRLIEQRQPEIIVDLTQKLMQFNQQKLLTKNEQEVNQIQQKIAQLDQQIEHWVYELYQLTNREISQISVIEIPGIFKDAGDLNDGNLNAGNLS